MEKTRTRMDGLDCCLEGGFLRGTVILISCGPGARKTLICLNFLISSAAIGERCWYIFFNESREELLCTCEDIGPLAAAIDPLGKNLIITTLDSSLPWAVQEFLETLKKYPSVNRLMVDSVNKLHLYSSHDRYYKHRPSDLANHLREKVGCSLILYEPEGEKRGGTIWGAIECDGAVSLSFLEYEAKPVRTLRVHKLGYSAFEPRVSSELIIDNEGLRCSDSCGLGGRAVQK